MSEPQGRTAHIVVDLQHFYSKKIHKSSAKALAKRIDAFRAALRLKGVPTIWVVFEPKKEDSQKMIILPLNPRADMLMENFSATGKEVVVSSTKHKAHEAYSFGNIQPHDDEIIFSKVYDNGFANSMLAQYLRQEGFTHLLIDGLYTSMCVSSTIIGGLKQGLHCTAVTDLMNDEEHPSPKYCQQTLLARSIHEEILGRKLKNDGKNYYQYWWRTLSERLRFSTAEDYLKVSSGARPRRRKAASTTSPVGL